MQVTQLNPVNLEQTPDLSRAFDITLAMEVYDSQHHVFSQWMDLQDNYSFPTFLPTEHNFRFNSTVRLTISLATTSISIIAPTRNLMARRG